MTMKRLALYAAAAVAMTGTMTVTSQAAVRTYVIGGDCGNSLGNSGCTTENNFSWGTGNGCGSMEQILRQMIPDCFSYGCDSPIPDCPGGSGDILIPNLPGPNYPGSSECPDSSKPEIPNPGIQPPDIQLPDIQNPDTQKPVIPNPDKPGTGIQKPDTPNTGGQITDQEKTYIQQVISLVNEERAKAGLSPVTESSDVSAAAAVRAQEITGSFSHTRPNGSNYSTALDQSGVKYMGSGENIAYGQRTPQEVMNGWMNSQGHRANILNKNYTTIGVGYYQNANGVGYWVQLFTY